MRVREKIASKLKNRRYCLMTSLHCEYTVTKSDSVFHCIFMALRSSTEVALLLF